MIKWKPILFSVIILIVSCSKKSTLDQDIPKENLTQQFFNQAKEEGDINKKLELLSLAAKKTKSIDDTLLMDIIDYKIYYHDIQKAYDSSLYYANMMINNASKLKDTSSLAKGYYRKARIFLYLNRHGQVLKNMYKSQNLYKSIGDSLKTGRRLVELANAQDRLGDFTGSHQSATEALKYLKAEDSTYIASVHVLLAITSSKLHDYDASIKENTEALKYVNTLEDSLIILNNLANNHIRNGNYNSSHEILVQAIDKANENSNFTLTLYDNFYYNQFLESGKDVVDELEDIARKRENLGDIEGQMETYKHLSLAYQNKNPRKSKEFAKMFLSSTRELGNPTEELEALKILISLDADQNKFAPTYFRINDSITEARNKIKNVFAKIKYDEEQKLKEIENLEQISANRKLELVKQKTENTIIIFILIILVLVGGFIYYFVREKNRKERIKEVYSTEARLSKKVHDELANDIFQIMIQLENSPEALNKLENVYQRTRDISKENSLINTESNFQNELRGMINGSLPANTKTILKGFQDIKWDFYTKEQKIVIYRTIQELLVNFRKHSKANFLVLKFEEEKSKLKITYKDNGVGADLKRKKFSGLRNMENRINSIGGNINFQSEIQNGFLSTIYIPI